MLNMLISLLEIGILQLNAGPEQQLKPLTTQQEVLLSSDDHNDGITEQVNAGNNLEQGNGKMEGQVDISRDYSSPEPDNINGDYGIVDDSNIGSQLVNDIKNTSNGIHDATKHVSVLEDVQNESSLDDKLVVPSENPILLDLSESENTVDSFNAYGSRDFDSKPAADAAESTTELKEIPFNVESGNLPNHDAKPPHFNTEQQDEITGSSGSGSSGISNTYSSGADNETEIVSTVVNPESSNTISDREFFPQDDQENFLSAPTKENPDLNKMPQVSAVGNKSSLEEQSNPENDLYRKSSVSSSTNILVDESVISDNNEVDKSISESPKPGSLFSVPGIPAPSVVSAAVQVHPGKILVPAAVDQVQGQALAALQVLKVTICSHSHVQGYGNAMCLYSSVLFFIQFFYSRLFLITHTQNSNQIPKFNISVLA